MTQDWRPLEVDGLLIESAKGDRLLVIPTAVLGILRHAAVIRFKRGAAMYSMRLDTFAETGQTTTPTPNSPQPQQSSGSAPTRDYGAPALPVHGANNPSPTPPPLTEGDPLDPANIPLRIHRAGAWKTIYVTRDEYERYEREGKLTHHPIDEGTQQ
jgi:hypothetical protein